MNNASREILLGLQFFPTAIAEAQAPEQRELGVGE